MVVGTSENGRTDRWMIKLKPFRELKLSSVLLFPVRERLYDKVFQQVGSELRATAVRQIWTPIDAALNRLLFQVIERKSENQ